MYICDDSVNVICRKGFGVMIKLSGNFIDSDGDEVSYIKDRTEEEYNNLIVDCPPERIQQLQTLKDLLINSLKHGKQTRIL